MALVTFWIWMVGCLLFCVPFFSGRISSFPSLSILSLSLSSLSLSLSFCFQIVCHSSFSLVFILILLSQLTSVKWIQYLFTPSVPPSLSRTLHLSLLCVFWRLDSEDLASWFSLSLFLSEEDIQNWVSFFSLFALPLLLRGINSVCVCVCVCVCQRMKRYCRGSERGDWWRFLDYRVTRSKCQRVNTGTQPFSRVKQWGKLIVLF